MCRASFLASVLGLAEHLAQLEVCPTSEFTSNLIILSRTATWATFYGLLGLIHHPSPGAAFCKCDLNSPGAYLHSIADTPPDGRETQYCFVGRGLVACPKPHSAEKPWKHQVQMFECKHWLQQSGRYLQWQHLSRMVHSFGTCGDENEFSR